ncbi:MFS transporter [Pannonibacter sp. P2PFMT1]|uniref:MFS transporter n=1 Tax=Pannonibacter sp. P2PFMT1 TaxID=2003582 RepID=UPI001646A31E|nr:MFS transporter [Pannonibacter sp. P2PFMT1]
MSKPQTYGAFLSCNARWLGAAFLMTAFSGFGQTFFISLSAGDVRAELDLSNGAFGSLYMAATLGSALTLPTLGRVLDRFSVAQVAAGVMVMLGLFCSLMASATSIWMVGLALYGLRLFGQGMMSNTAMTAAGRWFDAQRGRAVAVIGLGFPASEAIMPVTFVAIMTSFGWRQGWWVAVAVMLALVLPIVLLLLRKERVPVNTAMDVKVVERRHWTRAEVLRDPMFYLVSAGVLAPPFIVTAVLFHQAYLVDLRGWTRELFATAFIVMSASAVLSSLVLGQLIDRFTARRILPFMLVPLACGTAVLALVHAPYAPFIFMALIGLSNGFVATFTGALWPELYGTRHLGAVRSVVFAFMVFASALGPGLAGWLIDFGVPYDGQILGFSLYCVVMTAALASASRVLLKRDDLASTAD